MARLSPSPIKTTQSNHQQIQEVVNESRELSASIGNTVTKPEDRAMMINEIVQRPRIRDKLESDDDLLNELKRGECFDSVQ
jgi:F0F1-type ATP synthase delta subunit